MKTGKKDSSVRILMQVSNSQCRRGVLDLKDGVQETCDEGEDLSQGPEREREKETERKGQDLLEIHGDTVDQITLLMKCERSGWVTRTVGL